jgi:trypsin-like peptidase
MAMPEALQNSEPTTLFDRALLISICILTGSPMSNLLLAQRLVYSTIKINCISSNGNRRTGTGFFYSTSRNEWLLVTNNHLIQDSKTGEFTLTEGNKYNEPIPGSGIKRKIDNFSEMWIRHPDEAVDLCAMPMMPVITEIRREGKVPYFTRIEHSTIPSEEEWSDFIPTEDILMIGYPNGLWDKVNGLPFFKRGMTATHPYINYNGREEFVMDISVYPGSSGSPVFLLTDEFYVKSRSFQGGSDHARLLGIAYKHFKYNNKAKSIESENCNINDQEKSFPPIDLGIAIRSTKLVDFETIYPATL